jgi:hypothetical protein
VKDGDIIDHTTADKSKHSSGRVNIFKLCDFSSTYTQNIIHAYNYLLCIPVFVMNNYLLNKIYKNRDVVILV